MDKKRMIRSIPALLWMSVIYWLSDRPALESTVQSEEITLRILKAASMITGYNDMEVTERTMQIEPYIRETAHFLEYAVLGFLVLVAVRAFVTANGKISLISILICLTYALTDEVHQLFIPGRTFQLIDIILDTAGAAVVIAVFFVINSRPEQSLSETSREGEGLR